jgi:hypothetical protein
MVWVVCVLAACGRAERPLAVVGPCSEDAAAVREASLCVARKPNASQLVTTRAHAQEWGEVWNVWVPFAAPQMPAEALIKVSKKDCSCKWVPVM